MEGWGIIVLAVLIYLFLGTCVESGIREKWRVSFQNAILIIILWPLWMVIGIINNLRQPRQDC